MAALEGASRELKASDRLDFDDIPYSRMRAFFASLLPIDKVAKIKAPLMVLHGPTIFAIHLGMGQVVEKIYAALHRDPCLAPASPLC